MSITASQAEPLLAMNGITKRFGAVEALVDVDFTVNAREVVGLIGDNAAGKSTLAKIISGALDPTDGEIRIAGETVDIGSPADAHALGIATVFQDLAVCENLDVTANVFLGRELRTSKGMLREADMESATRQAIDDLGASIPSIRAPLSTLSGGQRQAVAIARTLISQPRLVVLDEPTASLSVAQTADVLTHIERLRDLGLGVIFISHNLGDIQAVSDRVEVLRHGRNNGSFSGPEVKHSDLIAAIIGTSRGTRPAV
ncbi:MULTISPECIES: ATP-binding cassette domain-containing protein [unclassified Microbacterium]|uniref:ATP-binding cassette domain-containing protein n=1 Tax=unclassified Microbacterium TaxID=2609290 RepID=UPI000D51EA63|nr:ATP-binding cassette domain-containing protein [Microbacterium sp. TPD7012]PVE94032.1 sugar ABC transporter ATP-binding protein [Microbacterium sp. TPD7012]